MINYNVKGATRKLNCVKMPLISVN